MSQITFQKATKRQIKARIALDGPSGAGKTWTGLTIASELGERVVWIDSERRSASLYSDLFDFDTYVFEPPYDPARLVDVLRAAEAEGYDVIGIDSLSHFWEGEGGTLDIVDGAARQQFGGNKYAGWSVATPVLRRLVDTMLGVDAHLVVSMRSKMDYVEVEDSRGRKSYEKVGMAPVMRAGIEYEFTLVGDMDLSHRLSVSKSRCHVVADKTYVAGAAGDLAKEFKAWLEDGEPVLNPEQLAEIRKIVVGVSDEDHRKQVVAILGDRFGAAAQILQSRFDEAISLANELAEVAPALDATPGPAVPAQDAQVDQPPPDPRDDALTTLEFAFMSMPDSQREPMRKEIKRTFGEYHEMELEHIAAALKMVEGWPKPAEPAAAAELPDPPVRSAKLRGLIAYARGESLDESHLDALAGFERGSREPRPLEELSDEQIKAVTTLIEDHKAGKLEFTTDDAGMVAREVVPA